MRSHNASVTMVQHNKPLQADALHGQLSGRTLARQLRGGAFSDGRRHRTQLVQEVMAAVRKFTVGEPQSDDITVLDRARRIAV